MASNTNGLSSFGCPRPFLAEADFPYRSGELAGRFCGNITSNLACCLPCPIEHWVYSDDFPNKLNIAYWLNVPALVLQVFLLVTFAALPEDVSHRHHLSIGLCLCLIMVEIAFIIPLGSKPDECYDEITPRNMYSSMSCAWSGALLVAGAMGCAVWIMLRSLWTHLRVCWDVKQTRSFFILTQLTGWGLTGLFLAICIPITGVSYRIGATCVPNQKNAFVTWFGWLIAFSCIAALLQFGTTIFCLWLYLKDVLRGRGSRTEASTRTSADTTSRPGTLAPQDRKLAWKRVKKVLSLQWRSIVLTTLVIIESVYFGVVFIHQTSQADRLTGSQGQSEEILSWAYCLVRNAGRKDNCLNISEVLGLDEDSIVASFMMAALIGICTFALMLRRSMLLGWWHLIRHPRRSSRPSIGEEDFIIVSPKRKSFGRQLESEKPQPTIDSAMAERNTPLLPPVSPVSPVSPILPDATTPGEEQRNLSIPQAGDVGRRHETTNWFDEEEQEELQRRRVSRLDDLA